MLPSNWLQIIIRLVLALLFGGAIGVERAENQHDAGLRTHILVCLGSCGIMVMSEAMFLDYHNDIGRIGAQVVSGIGFLGAGCILVNGNRIKGLTTAAGLWTTAAIGLSTGLGYYFLAVTMTALMLIAMLALHPIARKLQNRKVKKNYTLTVKSNGSLNYRAVTDIINESECQITELSSDDNGIFTIKLCGESESTVNPLICNIMNEKTVKSVKKG